MSTTAKALNPLILVFPEDLQTSVKTTMDFARLLNEARILLQQFDADGPEIGDFERRCRDKVGPIIEKRPAGA